TDLEALPDGSILFVDSDDHRIFRVAPGGVITTFAGNGECGSTGDGGPASRARLCWPSKITADKEGNTYVVDNGVRLRRVSPNGTISTVSGGDEHIHSGDGGLAADARFAAITDVVADSAENLYIGEWEAFRIRRISPDGRIDSVAGTGELSNP